MTVKRRPSAPPHHHHSPLRLVSSVLGANDDAELRRLTDQAFDLKLKGSPYLLDASAAIEEWHDRRHVRAAERRDARHAEVLRVMRETRPDRVLASRRAAA